MDNEQTRINQASNKLKPWLWVEGSQAAAFALAKDEITERLRIAQGLLDHTTFVQLLKSGEIEIVIFKNHCAALVTWGQSPEGTMLNVLTMTGTIEDWELALDQLEDAARANGAQLLVGIGHPGWKRLMRRKNFETYPRLFIRKLL